jgi:MFS family permease
VRWPVPLRSLENPSLRLFFAGQAISLAGTWMQSVAQGWLVWRLTHSSLLLGLVGFLGQLPVSLLGVWAGSLADRYPRRRLVLATQANAIVQATLLATVTLLGVVQPWHVVVLATMLGLTYAFEIPARQALLADVAGEHMPNAIALNASIVNAGRAIGPALAGWAVATVGEGWCFALNALSFLGTFYALWVMKVPPQATTPPGGHRAHLREGLRYAWATPHVRALLLMLGCSSLLAMPYVTLLPVVASEVLHGGATLFGWLQALAGVGAFAGATALLLRRGGLGGLARRIGLGATLLAAGVMVLGLSRSTPLSLAALLVTGLGFVTQMAGTMTLLQGLAPRELRGRVMGIFSTLFVGVAPFGALLAGLMAHQVGVTATLTAMASVVLVASLAFHWRLPTLRHAIAAARPDLDGDDLP